MSTANMDSKCCRKCGCVKLLSDFAKQSASKSGYGRWCKECHRANAKERRASGAYVDVNVKQRCKEWYAKNRERVIAKSAEWRENNLERARKNTLAAVHRRNSRIAGNGGSFTTEQIEELHKKQRGKCAVCREALKKYQIDHVFPVAKGGSSDILNLQLLCQPCNRSKSAKHPIDFMQERGFLL